MKPRSIVAAAALLLLAASAQGQQWPSFRGPNASGVGDGAPLPTTWDVAAGTNVRWTREVPGIGYSSPVVWGDRVFVTTALDRGAADGDRRSWQILALDRLTGNVVWQRTAVEAMLTLGRHAKASDVNATPATDGQRVVAILGERGLFAWDANGKRLWQQDLGPLAAGLARDPTSHWGWASSPILHEGRVFVQVDRHAGSFVAAFDAATGERLWTTPREELSSWATPAIHQGPERTELIVSSPTYVRGYDAATGKELWRFGTGEEVKVPTPVVAGDLVYVTGGFPRGGPIVGLRPGGMGDISLKEGQLASRRVAFRTVQGGPAVSTPIVYGGQRLYACDEGGRLSSYDAKTGKHLGRRDLPGNFSASPIAGDGKLYLASEEGTVYVVRAGNGLEVLASNDMGEPIMATPAIAAGTLIIRTRGRLYAIGTPAPPGR